MIVFSPQMEPEKYFKIKFSDPRTHIATILDSKWERNLDSHESLKAERQY